mgnify:CR=1 FL=1
MKSKTDPIWAEGYLACQSGVSINPYPQGTREYDLWNDGWWAAWYETAHEYNDSL